MSDHVLKTIEQIQNEVTMAEESLRPKKLLINQLCGVAGIPPIYTNIESSASVRGVSIRRNAFFGRPISTCIREYLEMRTALPVKEATLDEIFAALKEGGLDLKASAEKEEDQKRGVAITLGKNSQTFLRLPTGDFGLLAWYPNIKRSKESKQTGDMVRDYPETLRQYVANTETTLPPGVPEEFSTENMPKE